jgi:hypothetical protein
MRDRFRTFDSRISFFAFADIITAVSGMLVFITLLLATDLGKPAKKTSQSGHSEIEQRLMETLAQQAEADAQIHRLQELLAAADTAPGTDKLQTDIATLRQQLAAELKKQAALNVELTNSQTAIAARDKALGLTDLKATVDRTTREIESITENEVKARDKMSGLEGQVAHIESQLLKLRQRDGQLWLIPDKSTTTKEPILVTVAGTGVSIERFDHPDQRQQAEASYADSALTSYLGTAKTLDQYVVFLIRPSGIGLFKDLVKSARDLGFEVGFDALEEDRQIHFSTPPPIDDTSPLPDKPAAASAAENAGSSTNSAPAALPQKPDTQQPVTAPGSQSPTKTKSWWQELREWVGL